MQLTIAFASTTTLKADAAAASAATATTTAATADDAAIRMSVSLYLPNRKGKNACAADVISSINRQIEQLAASGTAVHSTRRVGRRVRLKCENRC